MSTVQLNDSLSNSTSTECVLLRDRTAVGLSFMSIILFSNFVVGLPANVYMVWLICRGTTELLASELYSLCLALCDIFYCLGLPAQLYCLYSVSDDDDGISILITLQLLLVWICRPIFQTCICVERYVAVVHPLIFIRFRTLKNKAAHCALAWCIFFLIVYSVATAPETRTIIYCSFFFIVIVHLYCYFSVLCSLKQPGPGKSEGAHRSRDKMKKKAFNIIMVHLVSVLVNYCPVMTVVYLGQRMNVPGIVYDILNAGVMCGHVQPLLYLHRAGKLPCLKRALS